MQHFSSKNWEMNNFEWVTNKFLTLHMRKNILIPSVIFIDYIKYLGSNFFDLTNPFYLKIFLDIYMDFSTTILYNTD